MFRVLVQDLDTGEVVSDSQWEHVETTVSRGFRRLDPDGEGPLPPELVETGALVATVKCWSGERVGMQKFEDFVNFTDDTGGAPDEPIEEDS